MSIYSKVPITKPNRNAFNLSHKFSGTLNIGEIKPIARPIECVPGDTMITGNISEIKLNPVVTDFDGELYFETWQFFVSLDSLYYSSDSAPFTKILGSIQDPQNILPLPYLNASGTFSNKSSWISYLYGIYLPSGSPSLSPKHILQYPARAVLAIYNEWIRDENLQPEIILSSFNKTILINYKKDRFTSAFTSTQKGIELRMKNVFKMPSTGSNVLKMFGTSTNQEIYLGTNVGLGSASIIGINTPGETVTSDQIAAQNKKFEDFMNSSFQGITINDLRLYNKLQKWQERNQLCGSTRTKEYLLANYGVAPSDETLQRPVLIGHTKTPVIIDPIISNIANDNSSVSLQNYQGSRGAVAKADSCFKYGKWLCKEFGYLITLGCLRPKAVYTQGLHKSLRKDSVVDFFNPIFQHLGQQPILTSEIMFTDSDSDDVVLGYNEIYNEMRHLEDFVAPDLAEDFPTYTMYRKFADPPTLTSNFIQVRPTEYDYLFAVPSTTAPHAFFKSRNIIKALRPLAKSSNHSL